jgi:hypothetical protein
VNLTIRQGVSLLVRRTWGTAQTAGALRLHWLWWQGYYHFSIQPLVNRRLMVQ